MGAYPGGYYPPPGFYPMMPQERGISALEAVAIAVPVTLAAQELFTSTTEATLKDRVDDIEKTQVASTVSAFAQGTAIQTAQQQISNISGAMGYTYMPPATATPTDTPTASP